MSSMRRINTARLTSSFLHHRNSFAAIGTSIPKCFLQSTPILYSKYMQPEQKNFPEANTQRFGEAILNYIFDDCPA